jgi:capsule polysaccharide export protein KpsE/RkpR
LIPGGGIKVKEHRLFATKEEAEHKEKIKNWRRMQMGDSKERLLAYYKAMSKGNTEQTEKILNKAVASLSDEEANTVVFDIDKRKEAMAKRLGVYAEMILTMKNKNDELQKYRDMVENLEEAYEDYDFDAEVEIELNGNTFSYDKDLDIEPYKETLIKIGDSTKGNAWRVDIEDGKVVLTE